jgi:hypothetical protein
MIKGNLVGLRAVEESDLATLRDWRNIESFRKHFREVRELNMANQSKWFEKTNNSPNDFMFVIVRLDTNEPIGACGLLYINWILRMADYSFYIGESENYIDDKFAKEATQLLLDYGYNQLNLNKVWMELYEYDTVKIDFFTQNFNFKQDGKLRDNCFYDGKYWDSYIISLLAKEHQSK